MEKPIQQFIKEQKNLSLCVVKERDPYCASCFYAMDEDIYALYFKSSRETEHIQRMLLNPLVAGTILPDIAKVGTIRGVQFNAVFKAMNTMEEKNAFEIYYSKFPFARVVPGDIWKIELTKVKMTDNTLGFGKKLYWVK